MISFYVSFGIVQKLFGRKIFKKSERLLGFMQKIFGYWWKEKHGLIYLDEETKELIQSPKEERILICFAPHGITAVSAAIHGFLDPNLQKMNVKVFTHQNMFFVPFFGMMCNKLGLYSISGKVLNQEMKKNGTQRLLIMPGGGEEMIYWQPNQHNLYLKNRKGFIKYAIRSGYSVLPVYTFGGTELYDSTFLTPKLPKKTKMQRYLSMALFLFLPFLFLKGKFHIFSMIPKRKPIYSFVGRLIDIKQDKNPSNEVLSHYHQRFIEELMWTREEGIKKMKKEVKKFRNLSFGHVKIV